MTTSPDYHAPHTFLVTRHADNWAMDHNPHPIASDDAKAWQKLFWDDQTRRYANWTGGVICSTLTLVFLICASSVMRP